MRALRLACALSALVVLSHVSAFAQAVTGTILGFVSDASGAVVANAKVTIAEVNTGVSRTPETNGSGNYTFPDVPQGTYKGAVESPSFRRDVSDNINVAINTSTRIDAV